VSESVYNYVDWEKKQFVKRVGCVDMGTLDWSVSNENANRFQARIYNIKSATADTADIVCAKYDSATGGANNTIFNYANRVYINDAAYTDAATFKAAMAGVMLYYELDTPEVTDITDLITADNYIDIQGGGSLTFVNQYSQAVPSTIEYGVKS
jgi:hypothetical protein